MACTGAYAANLLGLSEQVPLRVVFLRRTTPRNMATAGRASGSVIQALRWIGPRNVTEATIRMLPRAKEVTESGEILEPGDDEDLPYPRQRQRGQRVIHHGFVVDRQELLADHAGHRVEAGAVPAGEDYAFHESPPTLPARVRVTGEATPRGRACQWGRPWGAGRARGPVATGLTSCDNN